MKKNKLLLVSLLLTCALMVSCDIFEPIYPPSDTSFDYGFSPVSSTITKAETITFPEATSDEPALEDPRTLYEVLYDGIMNFETSIELERFEIPAEERFALSEYLSHALPECFHASTEHNWHYSLSRNILISVEITYLYTPEEYREEMAKCEQAADTILTGIVGNDDLSEAEKALLIHDRLALWCEYDLRGQNGGEIPHESYCMNGALVDGVAVCQGYMLAYGYLLDKVGIENHYADSETLNHTWNIVTIDGTPYHVDVTWDDPVCDITGRVNHTNFLRSSEAFAQSHDASDYETTPTDTTYDNAYWLSSQTAVQYLGGSFYYVDSEAEILYRLTDGESAEVFSVAGKWMVNDRQYYHSQTRLACDGVNLLYSQPDGVYAYNPANGTSAAVWKPDLSAGSYLAVYGFTYKNGQLICDLYNDANFPKNGAGVIEDRRSYVPS